MSDAPIVYIEDNTVYYRASSIGSCLRALWAARSGHTPKPPPPTLQAAYDKGHELEPMILGRLMSDHGWVVQNLQMEVKLHCGYNSLGQDIVVIGHVDATGWPKDEEWHTSQGMPIDAKAFAQSTVNDFYHHGLKGMPHYAWQQSAYALAMNSSEFCMPIYNKDTDVITVHIFNEIPISLEEIKNRVRYIESFFDGTTELDDPIPCENRWGCPYDYLHDIKESASLTDIQVGQAKAIRILGDKIAALEAAQKTLKTTLLDSLPFSADLRTFTSPDYSVSIVSNQRRLNMQALTDLLREAEVDIDDFYTPGQGVHIRVTPKKKD